MAMFQGPRWPCFRDPDDHVSGTQMTMFREQKKWGGIHNTVTLIAGIANFDKTRYLGVWYEYSNVFEPFQIGRRSLLILFYLFSRLRHILLPGQILVTRTNLSYQDKS